MKLQNKPVCPEALQTLASRLDGEVLILLTASPTAMTRQVHWFV